MLGGRAMTHHGTACPSLGATTGLCTELGLILGLPWLDVPMTSPTVFP